MPELEIIPATLDHARAIAPHLRADDIAEMWALGAWRPLEAMVYSVENSEAYSVMLPGDPVPILMFGVGKPALVDASRSVWLLATERVHMIKKRFVKETGQYLTLIAPGARVYNYVLSTNELSLRWLKWLGFNILEAKPRGWLNKPFHYVEKVIPSCVPSPPRH